MNTLGTTKIKSADRKPSNAAVNKNYLQEFLNLFWLRPETALLCSLLAKNIDVDQSMADNIDLSCGDGLFAFTLMGGQISRDFNLYASSRIESSIVDKKDIYNSFDSSSYVPKVVVPPRTSMRAGLDINENMLARSECVGIYRELIRARTEEYYQDGAGQNYSSATLFSTIFMYRNIEQLLASVCNILSDKGRFIVNVKTPLFRHFYEGLESRYPPGFARYIERNMRIVYPNLLEISDWERSFGNAGFSIISKRTTMNASMVPLWTIGLRSLTPLLIKLVACVPPDKIMEIKSEFVETFCTVMSELYDFGDESAQTGEAASLVYVLEKMDV